MAAINWGLTTTVSSVIHVVLASMPIVGILLYFAYLAYKRPDLQCYTNAEAEANVEQYCSLVPLEDMVIVCMVVSFLWMLLAMHISIYMPLFRKLVDRYMDEGEHCIGDIHYHEEQSCCCATVAYGHALYAHPQFKKYPLHIHRKVKVFERYTREQVGLIYLKGDFFSAQPKEEMEICQQIMRKNEWNLTACQYIIWFFVLLSYACPIYILYVQYVLDNDGLRVYQPDYYGGRIIPYFGIFSCVIAPCVAASIMILAWQRQEDFMTKQHSIWGQDSEGVNAVPSWFDDEECRRPVEHAPKKKVYRHLPNRRT